MEQQWTQTTTVLVLLLQLRRLSESTVGMWVDIRFQPILLCEGSVDLRGSLRGFGFVDCGIVWRSSLVRRMIGRMYSLKWGDIVLDSERSGIGSLCVSSVDNHSCEN